MNHSRHENNFNLLRLLAALGVVALHAVFVGYEFGTAKVEETAIYGSLNIFEKLAFDVGYLGLDVFFAISGFLVTASMVSRRDVPAFAKARFLRIFPGLAVVTAFAALLLGPAVSSHGVLNYFLDAATWKYLFGTVATTSHAFPLPGVFETLPARGAINIPLWTLKYEILFYAATAVAFLTGLFNSRLTFALLLGTFVAGLLWVSMFTDLRTQSSAIDHFAHFSLLYATGSGIWIFRDVVRLSIWIGAGLTIAAWLSAGTPVFEFMFGISVAYIAILIGSARAIPLTGLIRKHDYSYGTYIYHWPVAQTLLLTFPGVPTPVLLAGTVALTGMFAVLSWHFVERPALRLKQVSFKLGWRPKPEATI